MDISFEQKVRERAYEIWMAAGMADGMAHDHWCAAEQDLTPVAAKAMPAPAKSKATASKAPPSKAKVAVAKAVPAKAAKTKTAAPAKASPKKPALAAKKSSLVSATLN